MPTLMSEREAVTMSLALIQKAVVDDDGTGLGADILRPICGRVKNRHLIGVVKKQSSQGTRHCGTDIDNPASFRDRIR